MQRKAPRKKLMSLVRLCYPGGYSNVTTQHGYKVPTTALTHETPGMSRGKSQQWHGETGGIYHIQTNAIHYLAPTPSPRTHVFLEPKTTAQSWYHAPSPLQTPISETPPVINHALLFLLLMELVGRTAAGALRLPPLPNAGAVELAQTLHAAHLVTRLELFEADDALLRFAIGVHAVFLRRFVDGHAAGSVGGGAWAGLRRGCW